jgi:hypothetical protein
MDGHFVKHLFQFVTICCLILFGNGTIKSLCETVGFFSLFHIALLNMKIEAVQISPSMILYTLWALSHEIKGVFCIDRMFL